MSCSRRIEPDCQARRCSLSSLPSRSPWQSRRTSSWRGRSGPAFSCDGGRGFGSSRSQRPRSPSSQRPLPATAGASPIPSSPDGSSSTRVVAGIDGAEHILVAGDSVAWSLAYPFDQKAHPEVAVSSTTIFGCGVGVQQIVVDDVVTQRQDQCDTWPDTWRKAVEDVKPDVSVLVVSAWDIYDHEVDGQHLTVGSSAYSDYLLGRLGRAVDTLGAGGRPVVVVNSGCYDQESFSIQGVDLAPDRNNPSRAQAVNAVVRRLAALRPAQVSVADLFSLTCRNGHYSRSLSGTEPAQ